MRTLMEIQQECEKFYLATYWLSKRRRNKMWRKFAERFSDDELRLMIAAWG